ncbi:hypothetical protein AB0D83_35035 [Streptomyces decoyicus]|uniref:hypothetical protein n=1 Tax=Streptomyces decoyicus TaxID=249567 RepID=UPI0033D7FD63
MEPLEAGAVVGLIAAYAERLMNGMLDSAVADRLRGVWDAVAARFGDEPAAEDALNRLREQPDNELRQGAVQDRLQEMVDRDPEFGQMLAELMRTATEVGGGTGTTRVENSGAVAMDQGRVDIRGPIASGRDTNVHGSYRTELTEPSDDA